MTPARPGVPRKWLTDVRRWLKSAQKTALDIFEPVWSCESKERVGIPRYGAFGDGPKFMCGVDQLTEPCLVLNIGSNNEVSFEKALHEMTRCEIHTFDPTLKKPYIGGEYSHFYDVGLGAVAAPSSSKMKTEPLSKLIQMTGSHNADRRIDVLKVDCEGCE